MLSKVVVGVDGLHGGLDAVALARTLTAADGEIVLVNAHAPGAATVAWDLLRRAGTDPRFVQRAIEEPSAAAALHTVAREEQADLVVVGSCHRRLIGRALAGDVSRYVMHGAPCPVAIAPAGHRRRPSPVRSIAAGVNPHASARAAATWAAGLAADTGAALRLVTVLALPIAYAPEAAYAYAWPRLAEEDHEAARRDLEELAADLDVPVTISVVDGAAAPELEAVSHDADLLVVGSRAGGRFERVMLGSTALQLVHHAACPVVVVPPPSRSARSGRERMARAVSG